MAKRALHYEYITTIMESILRWLAIQSKVNDEHGSTIAVVGGTFEITEANIFIEVLSAAIMSTGEDLSGNELTENLINRRVAEARKLILDDFTLKKFRSDDEYIRRFLHCTNFNIPPTLQKMRDFYNFFREYSDWFASCPPLDKKERIEDNDKALLKERDKHGRAIYIVKLGKLNTEKSSPQEQAQVFEMWLEFAMLDPKTQATGISVILDMQDYSWKLFQWLTPTTIRATSKKIDLYPCKEFLIHLVNTSMLFNASLKLVWPFLSDRIKNMIKFHFDNWPSLHEYISPEVLPSAYGGTAPDINFEKSNTQLFEHNTEIGERLKSQKYFS